VWLFMEVADPADRLLWGVEAENRGDPLSPAKMFSALPPEREALFSGDELECFFLARAGACWIGFPRTAAR
jgi:hypothetical protein